MTLLSKLLDWIFQHLLLTFISQPIFHLPTQSCPSEVTFSPVTFLLKISPWSSLALTCPRGPFLCQPLTAPQLHSPQFTHVALVLSLLLECKALFSAIIPSPDRAPFSPSLIGSLLHKHSSDVIFSRKAALIFCPLPQPWWVTLHVSHPKPSYCPLSSSVFFSSWTISSLRTGTGS